MRLELKVHPLILITVTGDWDIGETFDTQPFRPKRIEFTTSSEAGEARLALADPMEVALIGLSDTLFTFGERFPFKLPAEMIDCTCFTAAATCCRAARTLWVGYSLQFAHSFHC